MAQIGRQFFGGRLVSALVQLAVLLTPLCSAAEPGPYEAGQRVGRVTILRENVFSPEERQHGILGDTGWVNENYFGILLAESLGPRGLDVAGLANRFHLKTQQRVIERELLFAPGQPLDYSLLEETERNLRALNFLRDASVTSSLADPKTADVLVRTQDSWTTQPQLSFSVLGGGHTNGAIGIEEDNLFGLGKQLELTHRQKLYRNSDSINYVDPQFWGTHWHLQTGIGHASDGHSISSSFQYPFYALEIPNSLGFSFSDVSDHERMFSDNSGLFAHHQSVYSVNAAHALVATSSLVRRIGVDYQRSSDDFHSLSPAFNMLGLSNRRSSLFDVNFLEWHPHFEKAYLLDLLGKPEDRDLGSTFRVSLGYAPAALASTRSEVNFSALWNSGGNFDDGGYVWFGGRVSGHQGSGKFRDTLATLEAIAYQHVNWHHDQTLVLDARMDWSNALTRDHELLAGGADGGLRGYPINSFTGTRRSIIHFEDRALFAEDVFH